MIYLILDVHYQDTQTPDGTQTTATVAGVRFRMMDNGDKTADEVLSTHSIQVSEVAPYQSGQFYKREMPCILALLDSIDEKDKPYDVIIIDGYVYLDGVAKAGLGKYLYDELMIKKPIIGIAKNKFANISEDYAVYRGKSKHPLYVTSVGFGNIGNVDNIYNEKPDNRHALQLVQDMAGEHRLPTMVKMVDGLARKQSNTNSKK